MPDVFEVNFDGLVGPTHHYGGLSQGNLASQAHRQQVAYPREAALQGLQKMRHLSELGVKQAVLPPHPRPDLAFLRHHGFSGEPSNAISAAHRERPDLLSVALSAASMWTANAATVSPSSDTADGLVHITPANLCSTQHRGLEASFTTSLLRTIFADSSCFEVHDPLPASTDNADEGAANHMRLAYGHGAAGLELFVYGRDGDSPTSRRPSVFPARQTRNASEKIIAQHRLDTRRTLLLQQHPDAIDAGVFHNDVIATSNENVLLVHEGAFVNQSNELARIRERFDGNLHLIEVSENDLPLSDAVRSYFFNSQLITLREGMLLLLPAESREIATAHAVAQSIERSDNPINRVEYIDLRQSMQNGGGPACLRLRVVLTDEELQRVKPSVLLTTKRYEQLRDCIEKHYPETFVLSDALQPGFLTRVAHTYQAIAEILDLKSAYKGIEG